MVSTSRHVVILPHPPAAVRATYFFLADCTVRAEVIPPSEEPSINVAHENLYSTNFFDRHRLESEQAASVVLPLLNHLARPTTCIDIGCGIGTWLTSAQRMWGADVIGVDGDYVDRRQLLIDVEKFHAHDLRESLPPLGTFDLAMSLEVIEHLPPSRGARLIDELCNLSDLVLFSGAVPNQGGTGHINEQWPSTWVREFSRNGYRCFDLVRPFIWGDERVAFYYRQNIFVAVDESNEDLMRLASERALQAPRLWDIIHPAQAAAWFRAASRPKPFGQAVQLAMKSGKDAFRRRFSHVMRHREP